MKPTLVIVGRPNVGKSTLFNRLTRSRDALVADQPGLTRDRHYGHGRLGTKPYLVVDTGGFEPQSKEGIVHEMARQAEAAIAEADVLVFVVLCPICCMSCDHVSFHMYNLGICTEWHGHPVSSHYLSSHGIHQVCGWYFVWKL